MLDWKLRKGAIDGQKGLHTRADYQDDLVTIAASSTELRDIDGNPISWDLIVQVGWLRH